MPLTPTCEVTPINPLASDWDSATGWNHYMSLNCYGVYHASSGGASLTNQYNKDKSVLYINPIPSPAPSSLPYHWYQYCVAQLNFRTNATTENQYLLIFHVRGLHQAKAAFYINGNLVRSEEVDGEEYIAILLDCPPSQTWYYAYMFLEDTGRLNLKGVQLFIL